MNEEDPKQPHSDSGPPTPQAPEPPSASGGTAEGGEGRVPAVEDKDGPVLGFPTSDGVKEGEKSAADDAGIETDSRVEDRISGSDGEERGVEAEKRLATEGDSTVHVAEGEDRVSGEAVGVEGRDQDFGVEDVEMVDDVQLGFTDLGAGGEVKETELPRVEGEEVRGVSGEEAGISSSPCIDGENSKEIEECTVKEEEMVVEESKSLDESMEVVGGSVPVDEIKTVGGDVSTQVNDLDVKMEEKAVEVLQQPDVREEVDKEVEVKAEGDAKLVHEMDDSKPMVSPVAPPRDEEMIEAPTPVSAGDGNIVGVDSDAAPEQKDLSVYSGAFAFDGITVGPDLVAVAEQKDLSVHSGASAGDGSNVGVDLVEVVEEKDVPIHNGAFAGDGNIVGDVSVAVMEDKDVPVNGGASATHGNTVGAASVVVVEEKGVLIDDGASADDAITAGVDSVAAPEEKDLLVYSEASAGDGNTVGDDSVALAEENDLSVSGEASTKGGGRKKRGRAPTVTSRSQKPPSTKKTEEDVCFICFDGGNLVVCDRRGCPKVYHPSCVNRDEAFFRARGRWNCGWHICSICEKAAQYMCYTCTYSLCKGCTKESAFVCVRGNKGLCETCRGTVMLIETSDQVKFDDKNSWEYLFKDYWLDLKEKQSITLDELTKARKPLKRSSVPNEESSDERFEANEGAGSSSDNSSGQRRGRTTRSNTKKKVKKRQKVNAKEDNSAKIGNSVGSSISGDNPWASNELLEFVSHMRGGDVSLLSQFDVQALLLEYIKQNNLRDPRRKSHIICDSRLERLFGKKRVGHFEMLKLLELHFLIKEPSQSAMDDDVGAADFPDGGQAEVESSDVGTKVSEKKRKTRKKEERGVKSNFGDYAAVDVHNIGLIYLRRNLMEDLIDDVENFNQKVIGSFVRIRISGAGQKQDMYRIVQVVGVTKVAEKYKTGKRTTDIALEILNLNKMEVIPIDSISNQDFTEEECKRLRQSIKCGLMRPMTVGDLEEKAMALQAARVNDWLESEKLRLGHLRDRASEKGHRKELRECVEKLELLSTPEERSRRLNEIPEIHADPNMDPSYESAEEKETDDKRKDKYNRPRDLGIARKGRELISPGRSAASHDSWTSGRNAASTTLEPIRNAARDPYGYDGNRAHEPIETPTSLAHAASSGQTARNSVAGPGQSTEIGMSPASSINESEKMWHYQDPSGKMQGPFSMVQLRKWNSTGYFPHDLSVWRTSERQEDSILLTDALIGRFQKELPVFEYQDNSTSQLLKPAFIVDTQEMTRDGGWRGNTVPGKPIQSDGTFPGAGQAHNNPISAAPLAGKSHQPSLGPARVISGGNPVGYRGSTWNSSRPAALHTSSVGRYSDLPTPTPGLTGASAHSNITRWDATPIQGVNAFQSPTIEPSRAAGWVERGAVQGSVEDPQNIPSAGEKKNNVDMYHNPVCPSPTLKSEQSIFIPNVNQNDRNRGSDAASVNASEWSMPSPTPSVNPSGSGMGPESVSVPVSIPTFGESVNKSTADQTVGSVAAGAVQANTNAGWGSAVQSSTNINWGMQQGAANVGWLDPTQGNVNMNMGWGSAGRVNPAASAVWRPPVQANTTMNAGWTAMQGNPNQNVGWNLTPVNANAAANWVPAAQGYSNQNPGWVAMNQETTGTNGVWVAPIQGNANNQIAGWRAPAQGNPNPTPAYGAVNGSINPGFSAPSGNSSNSWGPQRDNKDRHSSHVEGGYQGNNTGPGGGRHRMPPGNGGSSGPSQGDQTGICRFHESGHCKKGSSCNYLHT